MKMNVPGMSLMVSLLGESDSSDNSHVNATVYNFESGGEITLSQPGDYSLETLAGTLNFHLLKGESHTVRVQPGDNLSFRSLSLHSLGRSLPSLSQASLC